MSHNRLRRAGSAVDEALAAGDSMRAWGSRYARLMFERCGRNKRAASRVLDISYHTLEAYLCYGCASRTSGKRVPAWARLERDPERPCASTDKPVTHLS